MYRFTCLLIFCSLLLGCSKVPYSQEDKIYCIVENRIDKQVNWRQGFSLCEEEKAYISTMLQSELTADIAIQIALINNPRVQATFEELGIARSQLIEAGLLSNPTFETELRYPRKGGFKTNIEYLITTSLLDLFLIPLRTRLATTEFEKVKLKVSNEILDLAFETRKIFYKLIAEREKITFIQSNLEITNILTDIIAEQREVGNVNSLKLQISKAYQLEAEIELSQTKAETIRLKEKLLRLLGISEDICLILPDSLPNINYLGFDLPTLESIALENRLDLQVIKYEIIARLQMLGVKEWWSYLNLKGGLAGERDPDGLNLLGVGLSGEVPIFNYGQAARMQLISEIRQAHDQLAEHEIKILSEVREAHKLLMSYRKMLNHYLDQLLPMQQKISLSSEELYNVMGIGIDRLLENKRLEFAAKKNFTEITEKYLLARVDLDRALGGFLPCVMSDECFGR